MGLFDSLSRAIGGGGIADANTPTQGVMHEWLYGRFSKVVVGESNYKDAFLRAYDGLLGAVNGRKTEEFVEKVAVELRREPSNRFDPNAIQVWVLDSARPGQEWHAGYVAKDAAQRVAPVVDRARLQSWRHPALVAGTYSESAPRFGVVLQPDRRLTRGPDLRWILSRNEWAYGPPSEAAIGYFLRILDELPKEDRDYALRTFALVDVDFSDESTLSRHWDQRQLSLAIDILNGVALDSPWRSA